MARLVKIALIGVAALVGLAVIAAVALYIFFDPNDFRDEISTAVTEATGRELVIEGDLALSVFPWIAVEIGKTSLGNAEGFGDKPFLSFEQARLSVRLMPLLLRQDIAVGTASLSGLAVNLAVAKNGRNNWDDLAGGETAPAETADGETAGTGTLDVANVSVENAQLSYVDAQAGSSVVLSGLSFNTGRIAPGSPFDFEAAFAFLSQPGNVGGELRIRGTNTLGEDFAGSVVKTAAREAPRARRAITQAQRRARQAQGRYLAAIRKLSRQARAQVRDIRAKSGVDAAIRAAAKMAK